MKIQVPDLEQFVKFTTRRWNHFKYYSINLFRKFCYIQQYNDGDDYDIRVHAATINTIMCHY